MCGGDERKPHSGKAYGQAALRAFPSMKITLGFCYVVFSRDTNQLPREKNDMSILGNGMPKLACRCLNFQDAPWSLRSCNALEQSEDVFIHM